LQESNLINKLKEKYPKSIILFGSYNKGEDIESSDIDIFVDLNKFKFDSSEFERSLKRKIHLIFRQEPNKSLLESINQGTLLFGER
jgi:predicted nucleotidyltransferase